MFPLPHNYLFCTTQFEIFFVSERILSNLFNVNLFLLGRMYLKIVIFVLMTADFSRGLDDIHKFMTPEEVQQVFNTNHENVPEHEIVKVYLSQKFKNYHNEREATWKRGENRKRDLPLGSVIKTRAFGKNIKLWLVPNDRVLIGTSTPVYRAKSFLDSSGKQQVIFFREIDAFENVVRSLTDLRQKAFFTVRRDLSGNPKINGYIESKNLIIKSLPKSVIDKYRKKRRSLDDPENFLDSFDHVVYRNGINENSDKLFPPKGKVKLVKRQIGSGIPDTLYLEILVVADYSLFKFFGYNLDAVLNYMANTWNAVDLKFRSLESPGVRLHVSKIIVATDRNSTPYFANHMQTNTTFNRHPAMDEAEKFFYKLNTTFPVRSYDMVVTITNLGLIVSKGIANIGGACQVLDDSQKVKSMAFVNENGAYNAVSMAAHEIGHLLGAQHDDTKDCPESHNFIMVPGFSKSTHASDFSNCSLVKIQNQIKKKKLTCLYNKPNQDGDALPIVLPGQITSRDVICQKLGYFRSDFLDFPGLNQCSHVYCRLTPNQDDYLPVTAKESALDGTKCDKNDKTKFCLHSQCVSLNN